MFNISSYLEKFSKNISSAELHSEKILEILKKHTGISFEKNDIEVKNYIVDVSGSPAVKNKIFMYKKAILDDIALSLPITVVDIK